MHLKVECLSENIMKYDFHGSDTYWPISFLSRGVKGAQLGGEIFSGVLGDEGKSMSFWYGVLRVSGCLMVYESICCLRSSFHNPADSVSVVVQIGRWLLDINKEIESI